MTTMSGDAIDIMIGGRPFTLRGLVGEHIEVEWRAPLEHAVDIGAISEPSVLEIADQLAIADQLGAAAEQDFKQKLLATIDSLKQAWDLATTPDPLAGARFQVTELSVNTRTNVYRFGFGVALAGASLPAPGLGITLESFGLTFTYRKAAP